MLYADEQKPNEDTAGTYRKKLYEAKKRLRYFIIDIHNAEDSYISAWI